MSERQPDQAARGRAGGQRRGMASRAGRAGRAGLMGLAGLFALAPLTAAAQLALQTSAAPLALRDEVTIVGPRVHDAPQASRVAGEALKRQRAASSDSARLLEDLPGVSLGGAGSVSSLPSIHGLADDRLRIQVDGMDLVAACPNHMNPALSYIDPSRVGRVRVYAGVTPVSAGGDSIGGSIQVDSAEPVFAEAGGRRSEGRAATFYRSNGDEHGGSLSATHASDALSLTAFAAVTRHRNRHAARDFKPEAPGTEGGEPIAGDVIASSATTARNQGLGLAWRQGDHLVQFDISRQDQGFSGYPNQRMDMTVNRSVQTQLRYSTRFETGELLARAYQQKVQHRMDMGPDRYRYGFGMPMDADATTQGVAVDATLDLAEGQRLRLGLERQTFALYDRWPAVGGAMGPNTFWNIDDGRRVRNAAYAEWELRANEQWRLQAGLRAGRVSTDAAAVQGYDNSLAATWGTDAAAFNAKERRRSDPHLDATLIAQLTPAPGVLLEAGLARKTRSPSLYQRYVWSTQPMAALMNNVVGDGNGYIGNPDLRPEVAHTAALTAGWRDADDGRWDLRATAYLTQVHDFIDARRCDFGQCSAANVSATQGFVLLQYVNASARLQGLDLSGSARLARSEAWGDSTASFVLGLVRGHNRDTGDRLHNLMPPNLRVRLEQRQGAASAALELVAVAAKRRVSQVRNEVPTAGYALLNLRGAYEWGAWRLDAGIENLFNRSHAHPLGGAYLGQGPSMTTSGIAWGVPVPGPGRSLQLSLSTEF